MECATSHFLETTFSNNNIKYKTINSHIQSFDWKVRDLEPVRKEKNIIQSQLYIWQPAA